MSEVGEKMVDTETKDIKSNGKTEVGSEMKNAQAMGVKISSRKKRAMKSKSTKRARRKNPEIPFWRRFWYAAFYVIWTFAVVMASQFVVGVVAGMIIDDASEMTPVVSGIISLLSYVLAVVILVFVTPQIGLAWQIQREKQAKTAGKLGLAKISREELGLKGWPTWTDIGLSPVAFVVATFGAALLMGLFSAFPWFNAEEVQETGFSLYLYGVDRIIAFLVLVVLAPIAEEIIFRGFLYGKLRRKISAPTAVIVTSVLFGLMHFQWNVGVNVFALSVVLCVLREITGTIYSGILAHMIKNGVAFFMLYVVGM